MTKRINPYKLFTGVFVPEWLLQTDMISANAKLVYGRLCRYAGEKGVAYPKLETLAESVGMPVRTMQRGLKELVDTKLVEKERKGLGKANRYYFNAHEKMLPEVANPEWPNMANQEWPQVATPYIDRRESIEENKPLTPLKPETHIDLPDFIDPEAFRQFIEFRKSTNKKMTENAIGLLIGKLTAGYNNGHCPTKMIELSILSGWTGVFTNKDTKRIERMECETNQRGNRPSKTKTVNNTIEAIRRNEI